MERNCSNCISTHQMSGCGIFNSDGSNCDWWKDMFKVGSVVEIQNDLYEFYLKGKRTGQYARGIIEKEIDDVSFRLKLLCNGEECVVKRDWLKKI